MKIVFFGTPDYVLPILEAIHKSFKTKDGDSPIEAVVTQKPKPTGRDQILTYSPIDTWAHKKNIPIYFDAVDILKDNLQADLGILASYSQIIPMSVIKAFPHGILNIHPSLLPKYRGSSPVQAAILNGDNQTGVSIIKLDEKLDHGPIVTQFKEEILADDTSETLRNRLFEKSAQVLVELLPAYMQGKIHPKVQNEKEASITTQIKKEDGYIPQETLRAALIGKTPAKPWEIKFIKNFSVIPTPHTINCFTRAMTPWPGAWTFVRLSNAQGQETKRLKILKVHTEEIPSTKNNKLILDEIQLEGKNKVSWKQFSEGYPTNSIV